MAGYTTVKEEIIKKCISNITKYTLNQKVLFNDTKYTIKAIRVTLYNNGTVIQYNLDSDYSCIWVDEWQLTK